MEGRENGKVMVGGGRWKSVGELTIKIAIQRHCVALFCAASARTNTVFAEI